MLLPYLYSFQNGVILSSNIVTFDFMIIYVNGISSNIGENALCRKNGQYWHKMRWIWKPTSQFMLKFGLEIRLWGDTKTLCGDFWNFDFSRYFRGFESKILSKWQKFELWALEKKRKIKILKIAAWPFCITPKSISKPNVSMNGLVGS